MEESRIKSRIRTLHKIITNQLEMLLIPNALCWSSRKCNYACALPTEVQLRRSWQKLFAGKNFVKILVTAQTQLHSYSEQQRAFVATSAFCNWLLMGRSISRINPRGKEEDKIDSLSCMRLPTQLLGLKKKLLCRPFPTDPKSCKSWVGIFFFF